MFDTVTQHLEALLSEMHPVEHTILDERLWVTQPRTLEDIGQAYGLTRERVRQKQSELERKIDSCFGRVGREAASQLAQDLDLIDSYVKIELQIRAATPHVGDRVRRVVTHSLIDLAGYKIIDGSVVSRRAFSYVQQLKKLAKTYADTCGLIDPDQLIAAHPDDELRHHFVWFQKQCGFHEMFGMLALRSTRKAKLKAALLSLGRPATRPELAAMCGLTNKIASAALSSIPEIIRISRTQWALQDWGLHEYRGIVEEIVNYIDRDGGISKVEPLIEEIAQRFDVKKWSVRAYMQTPKFDMRDGIVRVAEETSTSLRPLSDVVHGHDDKQRPYWTFPVLERYFRGYSVVGLPFEIAAYLGCPPDDATTLEVRNLPGCHRLTIQWYLSSTTKASIGFVRDALERQKLSEGQCARLTLVREGVVELNWHPSSSRGRIKAKSDAMLADA